MIWEEEDLAYCYVLSRVPDVGWWHLHFGRSNYEYPCQLLGRRTNLAGRVQLLGRSPEPQSKPFLLTLDGEGIDSAAVKIDFHWDAVSAKEAADFRCNIMPLIYGSEEMHRAVEEIVTNQRHLRMVAAGKLTPLV